MQAIEFEAVATQHMLPVPEGVPDGVRLRVLVLLDEAATPPPASAGASGPRPSEKLVGSVVLQDDLLEPAVPPDDWDALK